MTQTSPLRSLADLAHHTRSSRPLLKIIVLSLQGAYTAEVHEGMEDHEVNELIRNALKSRQFKWYYLKSMLELKL